MGKTRKDLERGIRQWAPSNRRYLPHAKQTEADDLPAGAKLFRAAAGPKTVHAMRPRGR